MVPERQRWGGAHLLPTRLLLVTSWPGGSQMVVEPLFISKSFPLWRQSVRGRGGKWQKFWPIVSSYSNALASKLSATRVVYAYHNWNQLWTLWERDLACLSLKAERCYLPSSNWSNWSLHLVQLAPWEKWPLKGRFCICWHRLLRWEKETNYSRMVWKLRLHRWV